MQWEWTIFGPIDQKPHYRFGWNLKHTTTAWGPPTVPNVILIRQRGWSPLTLSLPLYRKVFFLVFFWFLRQAHRSHRWTDFNDVSVILRLSAQGCTFWGFRWYHPTQGVISQKTQIWEAWIGVFKPKVQNIKISISELLHRFQPNLHSDKDHQVFFIGSLNTRPRNPKWRTVAILKTVWPILTILFETPHGWRLLIFIFMCDLRVLCLLY